MQETRVTTQSVLTHIVARARFEATGRFGLRVVVGGVATPTFGETNRVLRMDEDVLVIEDDDHCRALAWTEYSLADLATEVGVDLTLPFSVGHDTPAIANPEQRLGETVELSALRTLCAALATGARALDRLLVDLHDATRPQLWPEHFDLACAATTASGGVNVGVSAGDGYHAEPYLYVGPWTDARPGEGYWNAPFGAICNAVDLDRDGAVAFFAEGLDRLGVPV